ncbi:hypothetical protein [Streptomyces sp. NPDC088674]|uniref:hypothetical protein n=1 Tax=Streptomyces sp. NPDC088674 TaxID=3365869 RepID=UPI0037F298BD
MTRARRLPLTVARRALAAADRLARGSTLLARRIATRLADWVARGRRHDLTGWRAALGPLLRLALLAGLGWLVWRLLQARIWWLTWSLAALWVGAAWALTREPEEEAADEWPEEDEEPPASPPGEAWRAFVVRSIGDRKGVHLRTLLALLQEVGHHPDWKVADVRLACERAGVPVRARVRVKGEGVSVGVHRDDLPSPSGSDEESPQEASDTQLHTA